MPLPIVFSHANGFPAGTYRQLFEIWRTAGHRVLAVSKFGHDPAYPVTSGWPHLRRQLLDFIAREAPGQRVHLVGHSLGGYLSLMAAIKQPEIAASVVLLDSPVLAGWRAHSVHMAKLTRVIARVSPGRVAEKRRHRWASVDEVRAHYAAKHLFARWAPGVLDDYIAAGIEPDPGSKTGGVRLAFDRDIEARIYNSIPHRLGAALKAHPPRCPVGFVGGTQSAEVRQVGLAATRVVTQGRMKWIEGTHLFPMEKPTETAQAVLELIAGAG